MAVQITSQEELAAWLEDKPPEWSQVIALRAALRVFPVSCSSPTAKRPINSGPPLAILRAFLVAVGAYRYRLNFSAPVAGSASIVETSTSLATALSALNATVFGGDYAGQAAATAARMMLESLVDEPQSHISAAVCAKNSHASMYAAIEKIAYGESDAADAYVAAAATRVPFWIVIESDYRSLEDGVPWQKLLRTDLWPSAPEWWANLWDRARSRLFGSGEGFGIWREWYYGRLQGLPHAFAGFDDAADTAFYRWIVEQDDDWWKREPGEVNGEISAFVDGLRKPMQVQESSDPPIRLTPDPQAEAAPTIARSEGNRLTLVEVALEVNPSAQRRFERARTRVEELLQFMESTNYGADFAAICGTILQSLGGSLEELDGDGIVLDTDSLRVEFETQQNPGRADEWEPLTGKPKRLVSDAISALNLLIGSDGKLEARETIRLGPDAEREIAEPKATVNLADALKKDDLIEPKAEKAARQAAKNAPSPPDPNNRRTALVTELGLNFARWTINFIVEYEDQLPNYAALAAGTGLIFDPLTTSAGIGLAWLLARNVHQNRENWRTIAAQARVTKQNFERLLKIIDRLPLD